MSALAVYTGRPYCFGSYNCWHHVRAVRADHGLTTPAFDCAAPSAITATFDDGHSDTKGMTQIAEPAPFCAVLLATKRGGRMIWHSGVYLDGLVSHCEMTSRQVRLDTLEELASTYQRVEFWQ